MGEVTEEEILRVSGNSPAEKLASAISHHVYAGKRIALRAIGAGAVNQAIKAVAIAQGYVAPRGLVLSVRPGFVDVPMDDRPGRPITGILLRVLAE